jgi:hypothetical protein
MLQAACIVTHSKHYLCWAPVCRFVGNVSEHMLLCVNVVGGNPRPKSAPGGVHIILGGVLAELPKRAIPSWRSCFAKEQRLRGRLEARTRSSGFIY